jgi:ribosomal protein S18 acetylase RimI-like enzyme
VTALAEVTLRRAVAADEPFLIGVYGGTRADELAPLPWSAEQKAAFVAQQFAAQKRHYAQFPAMTADVILVDGMPAGRLLVARWPAEIRIVDISLLPAARGAGAGGELLRRLMDEARAAALPLTIHVERHNRALALYARLGFAAVADEGVYLRMEWDPCRD